MPYRSLAAAAIDDSKDTEGSLPEQGIPDPVPVPGGDLEPAAPALPGPQDHIPIVDSGNVLRHQDEGIDPPQCRKAGVGTLAASCAVAACVVYGVISQEEDPELKGFVVGSYNLRCAEEQGDHGGCLERFS